MLEQRTLPPEPSSASAARRFAESVLRSWHEAELTEVVSLLVSELVTNAVLHAGSDVNVAVQHRGDTLRIEVGDRSPVLPGQRDYSHDATTGRGLGMLEQLANDWGVEAQPDNGKVVWFELPATHEVPVRQEPRAPRRAAVSPEDERAVRLLNAPVQLFPAVQQHADALLREYALISINHRGPRRPPPRLVIDMGAVEAQLHAALATGKTATDLVVAAPASARDAIAEAADALDVADRLAAHDKLLNAPALPEVRRCRQWFLGEVLSQLDGRQPTPWSPAPADDGRREALPIDHGLALDQLPIPVVVADDENHIAYVNEATADLLGWPRGLLEGQRLTAIIPPRLHDAHLAGYTRYQVTRRPRLLGRPVRLPARRRDGTEVEVEMLLDTYTPPRGGQLFAALLRPLDQRAGHDRGLNDHQWLGVIDGLLDRVVARDQPRGRDRDSAAASVLQTLVAELRWDFAAWWEPDGDTLRCRAVATPREQAHQRFAAATRQRRLHLGVGLPGRVWQTGAPEWIADVVSDANLPRAALALEHGLRTACAVPLVCDGDVTGVIELFSHDMQRCDDTLLAALTTVGRVLAAVGGH